MYFSWQSSIISTYLLLFLVAKRRALGEGQSEFGRTLPHPRQRGAGSRVLML
jgi:hypothetical protein